MRVSFTDRKSELTQKRFTMNGGKKLHKRRRMKTRVLGRAPRKSNSKTEGHLPPNENLRKFPDETYGDMQLPFTRR
jgi:hypothetical protein